MQIHSRIFMPSDCGPSPRDGSRLVNEKLFLKLWLNFSSPPVGIKYERCIKDKEFGFGFFS